MSNFQFVQAQNFSLAGAGAIAGATSVILKEFKAIDGITNLTMADFGLLGFATLEPGNGTQEEQISFTGVVQNANGTATLTGVKTVLFLSPYTASSGLAKTHPGSATLVISNTSGFYDQFAIKNNDETITGDWTFAGQVTFDIAPISPITNPLATTAIYGISRLSFAPVSALDPIAVSTNDPRVPVAYAVDAAGSDAYAITPSPAITAYGAGQHFTFQAGTANTGPATLAVSGLAATPILKAGSVALETGDIVSGQVVEVVYDGANMQLISANTQLASITVKGVSEEATPTEVNAGTQTGGTGADLFINPLSLPGKHIVGALGATMPKTYFNVQMLFILYTGSVINDTTTTFTNWSVSDIADIVPTSGGAMCQFTSTGSAVIQLESAGGQGSLLKDASTALRWNDTNIVIMDFWAILPASATGDIYMGFGNDNAWTDPLADTTNERAMFAMSAAGAILAVITKTGVGTSQTDISSGITNTVWNNFRIELDLTNNALFYINGVLKATLSGANLPSAANELVVGFGRDNTAVFAVTAPNISLQMNP